MAAVYPNRDVCSSTRSPSSMTSRARRASPDLEQRGRHGPPAEPPRTRSRPPSEPSRTLSSPSPDCCLVVPAVRGDHGRERHGDPVEEVWREVPHLDRGRKAVLGLVQAPQLYERPRLRGHRHQQCGTLSGRACDVDHALAVLDRALVALERRLRRTRNPPPEIQASGQLRVVERVHAGGRPVQRVERRQPEEVLRDRELACRHRFDGALTEQRRSLERLLGPGEHLLEALPVARAGCQLDLQQDGRARAGVLLGAIRDHQPRARVAKAAEQQLDAGAGCHDRQACGVLGRHALEDLAQRAMALLDLAGAGQRARHREQQLDALALRGGRVGQEPQRGCVPARRERGGSARARRGGRDEDGDRVRVAVLGRSLDVRGLRRRGGVPGGEHRRDPRVRMGSPAARGEVVDRRTDDRVAEGELPGGGGPVDEL